MYHSTRYLTNKHSVIAYVRKKCDKIYDENGAVTKEAVAVLCLVSFLHKTMNVVCMHLPASLFIIR